MDIPHKNRTFKFDALHGKDVERLEFNVLTGISNTQEKINDMISRGECGYIGHHLEHSDKIFEYLELTKEQLSQGWNICAITFFKDWDYFYGQPPYDYYIFIQDKRYPLNLESIFMYA